MTGAAPHVSDFDALRALCASCSALLKVTGAGISLAVDGSGETVAAVSDELAADVEELQFSLGEGPSREAYSTRRPILVADLADGNPHALRWPVFADSVQAIGVQAIFAFPFGHPGQPIGVLDVFRTQPGPLSTAQFSTARALADIAFTLLPTDAEQAELEGTDYRAEVHQASGMVAAQLDISTAEALVRLRARAFADGRTVSELAIDVVERRLRFAKDDP